MIISIFQCSLETINFTLKPVSSFTLKRVTILHLNYRISIRLHYGVVFYSNNRSGKSTTVHPNWLELPRDVTANILHRLGSIEILFSACKVCPLWWNICKDPYMWRTIRMKGLFYFRLTNGYNLVKILRNAVERSCGQAEDIDIEEIGTDDLLKHIADSWYFTKDLISSSHVCYIYKKKFGNKFLVLLRRLVS